jgi:hypothetical protein
LSYYLVIHRTQIDGEVEQLHKTNDLKWRELQFY